MGTSVVLFKDKAYNVDFGLLIPDYGILCLCCGIVFNFDDVEILYDFKGVAYLEQAVASGGFMTNCLMNFKRSTLARNNFDPLRRVFILYMISHA